MRKKMKKNNIGAVLFFGCLFMVALANMCRSKSAPQPSSSSSVPPSGDVLPARSINYSAADIFISAEAIQIDTMAASDPREVVQFYANLPPEHAVFTVVVLIINAGRVADALGLSPDHSKLGQKQTLFDYMPGGTQPAQLTFFEGPKELPQGSWNGYTIEGYGPVISDGPGIRMVVSVRGTPSRVKLAGFGWPGVDIGIAYRPKTTTTKRSKAKGPR